MTDDILQMIKEMMEVTEVKMDSDPDIPVYENLVPEDGHILEDDWFKE